MSDDLATTAAERLTLPGGIVAERWLPPSGTAAKPLLVLVHGAFAGSWCWQFCASWWAAQGWPVIAGNWRGHHLSEPLSDDALAATMVSDLVTDLQAVIDATSGPYVLVAHSIGAVVALAAAASAVPAPIAIVLIAPAPPQGSTPGYGPGPARDRSLPVAPDPESFGPLFFRNLDTAALGHYTSLLGRESPTVLDEVAAGYHVGSMPDDVPVLVISAGADALQPPESGIDRGVAEWAHGEFRTIPDSSHFLIVEAQWRDVATLVADFLTALPVTAPSALQQEMTG